MIKLKLSGEMDSRLIKRAERGMSRVTVGEPSTLRFNKSVYDCL